MIDITLTLLLGGIRPLYGQHQVLASFLDVVHGVVDILRDLVIDPQDLVVLLEAGSLALTTRHDLGHVDPCVVSMVLVQTFVDQRQAKPLQM